MLEAAMMSTECLNALGAGGPTGASSFPCNLRIFDDVYVKLNLPAYVEATLAILVSLSEACVLAGKEDHQKLLLPKISSLLTNQI